jgi:CheY-like chemotaxis protein
MERLNPILLVEDSANDVELMLSALEACDIVNPVVVLNDGNEALNFLRSRTLAADPSKLPAVLLLDIKMPKVDGIEVLRQVKADQRLKHLPVVMLTSSHESSDIETCYELGANGYAVKPIDFTEFFQTVKDIGRFWAVVNQPPQIADENDVPAEAFAG